MIKYFLTKQFLKFLLVGGSAAGINWIARMVINIWVNFSIAVIIAYLFGMTAAFILNKIYVFPESDRDTSKQIRDFAITNFIAFWIVWLMSIALKAALENHLGIYLYAAEIAHLIALSAPMLISFLIYKLVAFKED